MLKIPKEMSLDDALKLLYESDKKLSGRGVKEWSVDEAET